MWLNCMLSLLEVAAPTHVLMVGRSRLKLTVRKHTMLDALPAGLVQHRQLILATEAHDGCAELVIDLLRLVRTLRIEYL